MNKRRLRIFLFFLIGAVSLVGCVKSKRSGILEVEINGMDTCFVFTDAEDRVSVLREFTILKNSINDTISIGFGVVPPNFTGRITYTREGNKLLYDAIDIADMPRTDSICFESYKGKLGYGSISIQYYY